VNILVVNWQDPENPLAGGAEIHLFELFGRLSGRGHRVRAVVSGWKGCRPRASVQGVAVERVGGRYSFALLGRAAVRHAIRAERPDIVVEDINKLPLYLPTLTRLPFCVIVPHLFGTAAFSELAWPMAAIVWLSERPIPRVYRRAVFQAISQSTRDDLVARGIPPARIRVIRPGVDGGHYCPHPGLDRTPNPSFLYVGRLKRYKGIGIAIRALALARQQRQDLVLHIAGTGDDRPGLEALARALGVGEGVRFLGFVDEAEKLRLLRTTWAHVLPSVKEGWGISVMEAAGCGTPSLASDSPGLRDSVKDGRTGFLAPHEQPRALADRMLQLAGDRPLTERLGRQARAFAEELTWEAAAEMTESHLLETIGAGPPRVPRPPET
jgi:glycosyltransferase involved in cell wall biosynthesis